MKILLLTHYFAPDITGNAAIATGLAEGLARLGHTVTVVTSVPHYDKQAISPDYRHTIARRSVSIGGKLRVLYTWLYLANNKSSTFQRFLSYLSYNFASLAALSYRRHDIVLAISTPITTGIIASLIGWIWRVPYVFNVQDMFPDVLVELGLIRNKPFIKLLYALEAYVYRTASSVTVLSSAMAGKVNTKGAFNDKLYIIPNFVDIDFITPRNKENSWSRRHGLQGKFVLMYTGNIGQAQSIDILIEAAPYLENLPDLRIVIVGDGSAKPDLIKRAAALNAKNILFLPLESRENLPDLIASADLMLVSLRRGVTAHSVPSKTFTIMAGGRPMIASVEIGNPVYEIVKASDCGFHIPPEDVEALVAVVRQAVEKPERLAQKGCNGRKYVVERFSMESVVECYDQLLTGLIKSST